MPFRQRSGVRALRDGHLPRYHSNCPNSLKHQAREEIMCNWQQRTSAAVVLWVLLVVPAARAWGAPVTVRLQGIIAEVDYQTRGIEVGELFELEFVYKVNANGTSSQDDLANSFRYLSFDNLES